MITNPIKQKRNYNVAQIMQRIGVDKILCTSIMTKRIIGFNAEQINRMYLNILLVMFIIFLLLSHVVSWVKCGTGLYRFLIFAVFLILVLE